MTTINCKLFPCKGALSPWVMEWYELNTIEVRYSITNPISEYKSKSKDNFYFRQLKHGSTKIEIKIIITDDSDIPGVDMEEKKNNLIYCINSWWLRSDCGVKSNNPMINIFGNIDYVIIEKIDVDQMPGDTEYECTISMIKHQGL